MNLEHKLIAHAWAVARDAKNAICDAKTFRALCIAAEMDGIAKDGVVEMTIQGETRCVWLVEGLPEGTLVPAREEEVRHTSKEQEALDKLASAKRDSGDRFRQLPGGGVEWRGDPTVGEG